MSIERKILERLGYEITCHLNSVEALQSFKADPGSVDLVITDMAMPDMTGEQLVRELTAVRPDIPIIICTGFSERINKDNAAALGVKDFLMKPVIRSEMAATVRKVLDSQQISSEL